MKIPLQVIFSNREIGMPIWNVSNLIILMSSLLLLLFLGMSNMIATIPGIVGPLVADSVAVCIRAAIAAT